MEKTDTKLKADVLSELQYDPTIKVADIGVSVKDGTVTLNGYTSSYEKKLEVVSAAQRVTGVSAIADKIEVKLPNLMSQADREIADAAAIRIDRFTTIPTGAVEVAVRDGWIALDGVVEWWYLKNVAGNVVRRVLGVKGVTNSIAIEPKLSARDVEREIKSSFQQNALLDAQNIQVETSRNNAILRGKVWSDREKSEAERAALSARGVLSVDNQLTVKLD